MNTKQLIGLNLRYTDSFEAVIETAHLLQLPIFQVFFVTPQGSMPIDDEMVRKFRDVRDSFASLYAHSSYIVNIADPFYYEHPALKREIYRIQKLAFSHLILHPGALTNGLTRQEALGVVVKQLNRLVTRFPDINFVLENGAYGKKALAGDLEELLYIRSRLDRPEKVTFCIDTAHAHVFGYDIQEPGWIEWMCSLLSPESISLIHLNDTQEQRGSCIDRHCVVGQGELHTTLRTWINHPLLREKPIILELPPLAHEEQRMIVEEVRSWKKVGCENAYSNKWIWPHR